MDAGADEEHQRAYDELLRRDPPIESSFFPWELFGIGKGLFSGIRFGVSAIGSRFAAKGIDDFSARASGMLRDATKGKGDFGLGSATRAEADDIGRAWVGRGAEVSRDGKALVSMDKLRQYRPASYKASLGRWQANLEERLLPQGKWQSNGHIDIVD
jgi:hypothetical protein